MKRPTLTVRVLMVLIAVVAIAFGLWGRQRARYFRGRAAAAAFVREFRLQEAKFLEQDAIVYERLRERYRHLPESEVEQILAKARERSREEADRMGQAARDYEAERARYERAARPLEPFEPSVWLPGLPKKKKATPSRAPGDAPGRPTAPVSGDATHPGASP